MLKNCLHDLDALYTEAVHILNKLLAHPSAAIVRRLCARFRALQECFIQRYHEAKAHAIAALGRVEASFCFP